MLAKLRVLKGDINERERARNSSNAKQISGSHFFTHLAINIINYLLKLTSTVQQPSLFVFFGYYIPAPLSSLTMNSESLSFKLKAELCVIGLIMPRKN